jgi:hypothetical protein
MEGYQMFTIFVPKKVGAESKKKTAAPKPETTPAPEKKSRADRPKVDIPKPEPTKDDDEIF